MKNKKLLSFLLIGILLIVPEMSLLGAGKALAQAVSSSPNLIQNPSVETANGTSPSSWLQGGVDGTNDAVYSYPVAPGFGSNSAVNVKITTYTSGDAKWYFTEVPVVPGQSYIFTDNYLSNTTTELAAEYLDANHALLSFGGFTSVPVSPAPTAKSPQDDSAWGSGSAIFTPPAGTAFMTVFHSLQSVGSLTTDNFSLTEVPPPVPFDQGFVSLTFDDGLTSQYTNALPELTTAGIKGTFYVVSHIVSGLSILNPSLEQAGTNGPADWSNTGGVNATYTYPVAGHTGSSAAEVSSTTTGSNAGWYFNPITVLNDHIYSFSGWYKSTAASELIVQITNPNGTITQADITDISGNTLSGSVVLPSSNDTWMQESAYFYVPPTAKSVTVLNRLTGIGNLTVDDYSLGSVGYMTSDQVKSLQTDGQEVGGHTQSHYQDLTTLSSVDATQEINGGRQDLLVNNLTPVLSFDYPYGAYNPSVESIVQTSGFTSARTVTPGFNGKNTDPFALYAQSVNADTTLATVESWITQANTDKTWLILVFHDIKTDLTNDPYGATPSNLQAIINYLKTNNIPTQTVSEGLALMTGSPPPPPPPPPLPTLSTIAITTPATKLSYTVGDSLDIAGLVVTGTYSDSSTQVETVTASDVTGFNSSAPATGQVLTVTIGGKTTTYTIDVVAATPTLSTIAITTPATKLSYTVGDSLDIGGLVVTGTYSDSSTQVETVTASDVTGFNSSAPATGQVLTVTIGGKTTTYTIDVVAAVPPPTPSPSGGGGGGFAGGGGGGSFSGGRNPLIFSTTPATNVLPPALTNIFSPAPTGRVLGAQAFHFSLFLKRGSKGNEVTELQKFLNSAGYDIGTADGRFGPKTGTALAKFQLANGLRGDGIVGPKTRGFLNK